MSGLYDTVYSPSALQGFPVNLQTPALPAPPPPGALQQLFDNGEGQGGQGANTTPGNVGGVVGGMVGAGTPGFGTSPSLGAFMGNIATGLGLLGLGPGGALVGPALTAGRMIGTMVTNPERDKFYGIQDILGSILGRGDPQFGPEVTDAVLGTEPNPANPFGMTQKGGVLSEVETPGPPAETKGADPSYGGVYRHGGRVRGPLSYLR